MLSARDATVTRGGRLVLDGATLDLRPGRVVADPGPNGAGKSTLLKAISREWPLASGAIKLDGLDIAGLSAATLSRHRAVVPQATPLAFPFTALEVVMLGATVPGFGLHTDQAPATNALAEVGLEGFVTRRYTELSGGERQRVTIARALCQLDMSPAPPDASKFLLLDEPASSLDPAQQVALLNLLRARAEFGLGVVLVLHDINLAAAWA
ncbi:MAG: ATP-binding cassette domain-containing protein, partial [Verrucomicrobiae bacterium]|nr:ATP-binding cassette domain-containing protein [Verrucomicrobiae bacterium]